MGVADALLPSLIHLTLSVGAPKTPSKKREASASPEREPSGAGPSTSEPAPEPEPEPLKPEPVPWVPTPLHEQPVHDVYDDYGSSDGFIVAMAAAAQRDPRQKLVYMIMDVELYLRLSRMKGATSTQQRWEEFWAKPLYEEEWAAGRFAKPPHPSMQVRWDGEDREAWVVQPMEEGRHRAWWIRHMLGYNRLVVLVRFQWAEGDMHPDDDANPTGPNEVIVTPDDDQYEAAEAVWSKELASVEGSVYHQLI